MLPLTVPLVACPDVALPRIRVWRILHAEVLLWRFYYENASRLQRPSRSGVVMGAR
jgi:hypothetical protein